MMAHECLKLAHWPADAIISRNMYGLIRHTHADGRHYPEADCPIFKALLQGLPCRIDDEVFWRADGLAFDAEYTSHPIIEHGVVRGAVVTLVDITQRRETQALLRKTNEQLETRVAERTSALSHALARLRELGEDSIFKHPFFFLMTPRTRHPTHLSRSLKVAENC